MGASVRTSIAVLLVLSPSVAEAQWERFALRVEAGAGAMLSEHQREVLDYGVAVETSFRPSVRLLPPLSLELVIASWFYPTDSDVVLRGRDGTGSQLTLGGGLRVEPRLGRAGRAFIDVAGGAGYTGGLWRVAFDVGIGFEFAAGDHIGIGPFARYGHLFAQDGDQGGDAQTVIGGISFALHGAAPEEAAGPDDQDGDGIVDAEDLCPETPAGATPDPDRTGCPLVDSDGDGVPDGSDLCPDVPAGDHPDPERSGCPAADSDGDSVLDADDACPTTPAGDHPDPERRGCPDGDDDADGVLNHDDACRDRPQGPSPDPARPGCPLPDRDGDTVPDATDACPDEAGVPSEDPERNGCPNRLVRLEAGSIVINRPVFFATNRDVILGRSRPVLEAVAAVLQAATWIRGLSIEGHTDDRGEEAFNQDLSNRRAGNVMAWLIQEGGIEPERLEAHGFGETRPVVPGTTTQARAANRRVEFRIVDPPMASEPETGGEP